MSRKCLDDEIPCISYHPFKENYSWQIDSTYYATIYIEYIELPKLEKSGEKLTFNFSGRSFMQNLNFKPRGPPDEGGWEPLKAAP